MSISRTPGTGRVESSILHGMRSSFSIIQCYHPRPNLIPYTLGINEGGGFLVCTERIYRSKAPHSVGTRISICECLRYTQSHIQGVIGHDLASITISMFSIKHQREWPTPWLKCSPCISVSKRWSWIYSHSRDKFRWGTKENRGELVMVIVILVF